MRRPPGRPGPALRTARRPGRRRHCSGGDLRGPAAPPRFWLLGVFPPRLTHFRLVRRASGSSDVLPARVARGGEGTRPRAHPRPGRASSPGRRVPRARAASLRGASRRERRRSVGAARAGLPGPPGGAPRGRLVGAEPRGQGQGSAQKPGRLPARDGHPGAAPVPRDAESERRPGAAGTPPCAAGFPPGVPRCAPGGASAMCMRGGASPGHSGAGLQMTGQRLTDYSDA